MQSAIGVSMRVQVISATAAFAALSLLGQTAASAAEANCDRVAAETISVDGMLDDWSGFRGRVLGSKAAGSSLTVRCAYDATHLFVVADVRDDRVIRGKAGDAKREDFVSFRIAAPGGKAISVKVFPGTRGFRPKVTGARKIVEVADSLQPKGFSVEVSIPLAKLPKWHRGLPALVANIRFGDVDDRKKGPRFRGGKVRLSFSGAAATFKAFLKTARLSRSQIRLDVHRDVDLGAGAERVVAGGAVVGVLSDNFIFMQLPVADPSDVIKVQVINFSGTGRSQIVAHYRQHGNGMREIVGVWTVDANQRFERLLAFEVKKVLGANSITNEWSYKRPGAMRAKTKTSRRGWDIVVEATEAVGFNADNYREMIDTSLDTILLPWSDEDTRVYYFEGDSLGGSEAMDPKISAKRKKAREKRSKSR